MKNQMASFDLLDDILAALATQDRRYVLYYLQEKNEVDVEELARQVAAWKSKKSTADVTNDELQRVLTEFHHNHLEKLRDAECIEYDERSGAVRYRSPPKLLEAFMRLLAPFEQPESGTHP